MAVDPEKIQVESPVATDASPTSPVKTEEPAEAPVVTFKTWIVAGVRIYHSLCINFRVN